MRNLLGANRSCYPYHNGLAGLIGGERESGVSFGESLAPPFGLSCVQPSNSAQPIADPLQGQQGFGTRGLVEGVREPVGAARREVWTFFVTADDKGAGRQPGKDYIEKGKPHRAFRRQVAASATRRSQQETGGDARITEILSLNTGAQQQASSMTTKRMARRRYTGMIQPPGDGRSLALDLGKSVEDGFHLRDPLAAEIWRAFRIRRQAAHTGTRMGRLDHRKVTLGQKLRQMNVAVL